MAEILLRVFCPFPRAKARYMRTRNIFHEQDNIRFDENLGCMPGPNLAVSFHNREYDTKIYTNSSGFRDDEESLKDPDILILGDSFGFGWGVNNNQTCERILENSCNARVLNMSVPAYGTTQQFLLLRRWALSNKLSNKVAIFLFCKNDLRDNFGYEVGPWSALEVEEGTLKFLKAKESDFMNHFYIYNSKKRRIMRTLRRISYIADFTEVLILRVQQKLSRFFKGEDPNKLKEKLYEANKYQVFDLIVKEIKAFAKKENINIVFVYIPPIMYAGGGDDSLLFSKVKTILSNAHFPLIDLRNTLLEDDYYRYDGHWKPSGHYKAATEIKRFLVENYPSYHAILQEPYK